VDITWLDPQAPQRHDVDGAVSVFEANRVLECPDVAGHTPTSYIALMRHGWDADPPAVAVAHDERDRVTGVVEVWFPRWDNLHVGYLWVTVDPRDRRRGIGRQLFEAGAERVRARGRTLLLSSCADEPANVAFLKAQGMDRASDGIQRVQDVAGLDWTALDERYATAQVHAVDYELVRLAGPTPEELVPAVAMLTEAINDSPIDDLKIEDEVFTPERIHAFEESQLARGRRLYRVMARQRHTGAPAGHTAIAIESEQPWFGWQLDTSVLAAHRGHRLGQLLKLDMLRWLAEVEPQLRTVQTHNAASNDHMIQINEVLGYRVAVRDIEWQRSL
jgi:GNAT superfamily N-acetyltransferase